MNVTESIVWGIILIPMIIMSLFLMNGKGAFLIAGYNTMSKEKQAKYDVKAMCRSVGRFLLWTVCCTFLLPFAIHSGDPWMPIYVGGIIMASSLVFVIYANTGNRFLKKEYESEPQSEDCADGA
jgi:membrane protein YdbS with pleckstrin-like domain